MSIEFQTEKHSDQEIFRELNPLLSAWFKWKFKEFTEPQRFAILNVHRRENTLISAPTGTGKTLSTFAAILSELFSLNDSNQLEDKIYCVYVSPLKALNNDIQRNLLEPLEDIKKAAKKINKEIRIRIAVRTGDTTASERSKMLSNPPHILITTPESLAIILNSPKFKENLKDIKWLVIDEIHALANNKRGVHLSISMERLQEVSPNLTRIGLSATVSPLDEVAKYLVGLQGKNERNCKIVDVQFLKKLDLKVLSPLNNFIDVTQEEIQKKLYSLLHQLIQDHTTTLVFTNTRSATERVVHNLKEKFPTKYGSNIEAHHSSLSRELRLRTEERLKKGELKVVVSSTSLELGIDIGFIDLVVLLGSPKGVARLLQRVGRSGHNLHDTVKGRIIVLDRDDLIECSVMLKDAIEKNLDKIQIPKNCLDVLAQQIYGMLIDQRREEKELLNLIRQSYCFKDLSKEDFEDILSYLSGEFVSLESRHVYAKIWWDRENGLLGKKGKTARLIYMTNIGTIPEEARVKVKIETQTIGSIDEFFAEKLKKGDVFVLGGQSYVFKYSRGMTIQVSAAYKRPPTVPSWFSEMLPLSFDTAIEIGKFRELMNEKFEFNKTRKEIIEFIHKYLYLDNNSAEAIYSYFREQFHYAKIPSHKKILIEHYKEANLKHIIFHTLFGRKTNDALSRTFAYVIGKMLHKDIEITLNDNGFILTLNDKVSISSILKYIKSNELRKLLENAIMDSEIMKRRFRHCATRSLMILRSYKGKSKSVGRQQASAFLLLHAVKRVSENFPILRETKREILEDAMDLTHSKEIIEGIENGKIKVIEIQSQSPSPFAFNLFAQGYADIMKMEGRLEFIKRMHEEVMKKIGEKNVA